MSWRIDNHPQGGMMIEHLEAPRFTARWTTGAFPIDEVRDGAFFWSDEGGSPEDAIHLYGFDWRDAVPERARLTRIMATAITAIDAQIVHRS
jgi:hypothetical protein